MNLRQKGEHFSKQIIMQAVAEVKSGLSRKEVCAKFGMSYQSLCLWLKRYGGQEFLESVRSKVNSHERRLIVSNVEHGRMSIVEASTSYKVSKDTIRKWLRANKNSNNVDIDSNPSLMPTLNDRTKELQHALHEANLKILALETLIDVAEKQLNIGIRKKPGAKQ